MVSSSRATRFFLFITNCTVTGSYSQDQKHILLEVQEAQRAQSVSIQEGKGFSDRLGQKKI